MPGTTVIPEVAVLRDALAQARTGGKRLRPRLVRLVHDCLGGTAHQALDDVGCAIELLHTAFVVHDDLIDGDDVRRGRPSVPGRFHADGVAAGVDDRAARAYAVAGAVLTGDLALAGAVRAVATAPLPHQTVQRILDMLESAVLESAAGELADVRYSLGLGRPTLDDVLQMEESKTAAYSFALPMQAGAVLADASEEQVGAIGAIGRSLGVAYQLRDDLDGVFGVEALTGKQGRSDLGKRKLTPLMVHARNTAQWRLIEPLLGDASITPAQVAMVQRALGESGSRAFIEKLASSYEQRAEAGAAGSDLSPTLVPGLLGLFRDTERGVA